MSVEIGSRSRDDLSTDEVFDLLSSPRRRFVLAYLLETGEEASLRVVADELAAHETGKEVADLSPSERKRVYVSLYQTHAPRLAEAGLVAYDEDEGTVGLTDRVDEVSVYLGYEPRWRPGRYYYFALAAGGIFVSLAAAIGLAPFHVVPPSVAVVIAAMSAGLAVIGYVGPGSTTAGASPPSVR